MTVANTDIKLTDSLERQLTEQALAQQAQAGLSLSAILQNILQNIRFVLTGVLDGVFAARREAAKGEW